MFLCLLALSAIAVPSTVAASETEPEFLFLAPRTFDEISPEQCPLRLEIPIGDLFRGTEEAELVVDEARGLRCGLATLHDIRLELDRRRLKARLDVTPSFFEEAGEHDWQVRFVFELRSGDEVVHRLEAQTEDADEGELNDETFRLRLLLADLGLIQKEGAPPPTLRIEMRMAEKPDD